MAAHIDAMHPRSIDGGQADQARLILRRDANRFERCAAFVRHGRRQTDVVRGNVFLQRFAGLDRLPRGAGDREAQQFLNERRERQRPRPLRPIRVERTGEDDDAATMTRPVDDGRVEPFDLRVAFRRQETEYAPRRPSRGQIETHVSAEIWRRKARSLFLGLEARQWGALERLFVRMEREVLSFSRSANADERPRQQAIAVVKQHAIVSVDVPGGVWA